ncbi:5-hydroxytryptamine receptor 1A-like [Ptychodera flava]|uniref:5-hydroxytryptamine receptor 1A-like n=1 Tax=Ptychodera flava TaxID=63121 RepID=UPI00396A8706
MDLYDVGINNSIKLEDDNNLTLYFYATSYELLSNLTNLTALKLNDTSDVIVSITVEKVVGVVLVFFLVALTVFGNVFVLSAIILEKNLRTVPNYFISSLAAADLLVASLVMPLTCVYDVTETWILGSFMCDVWVSFDVLCCTSSILNLCVIALDRYWVITKPIEYMKKRTPRRAFGMIILAWTVSVLISIAPLFGWRTEEDKADPTKCVISQDYAYTIFSTFGAFYIPLTIMLIVYGKIYVAARNRIRGKRYRVEMSSSSITLDSPKTAITKLTNGQNGLETSDQVITRLRRSKRELTMARERKATRTLGIIIGAFVVCWLPFFIVALVMPFCETCYVAPTLKRFLVWLGYVNSLLNPLIYTYFNQDFKNAFRKLISCRYCNG